MIRKVFCDAHSANRFPIDAVSLAVEHSKQFFPKEPITKVYGENFGEQFEGARGTNDDKKEWLIIYNQSIQNTGRINFTVAHEFGHYLFHRQNIVTRKQCTRRDMSNWRYSDNNIEVEANTFAANFLMPTEDFAKQIYDQEISLSLIQRLATRYKVSLSALALRLIDFIKQPAMVVCGNDGFIDWVWSNKPLIKLGIYYPAKQKTIELPSESLAKFDPQEVTECVHNERAWIGPGQVKEILIYHKDEYSLSLLLYDSILNKNDQTDGLTEHEEGFV